MPQRGLIFRILVASPSDCDRERRIVPDVIRNWNAANSLTTAAIIEPVLWETHTRPELGNRPQGVVNRQIVDSCDLLVGTFWTRLGTPTGDAESGTAEEIDRFRSAGKPVMLYFSSIPVVPDNLDQIQYQALTEYRGRLETEGLVSRYESLADFRDQFQRHLAGQMQELLEANQDSSTSEPAEGSSAATPEAQFAARLGDLVRRLSAEWASERDSDPTGIEEGQNILARALDAVIDLRSMVTSDPSGTITGPLDETARQLRALARHQLFLDGGASFRQFWAGGDSVIGTLTALLSTLSQSSDAEENV